MVYTQNAKNAQKITQGALSNRVNLKKAGVKKVFTMRHVDRFGIGKIVEMTLDHLKPRYTHSDRRI